MSRHGVLLTWAAILGQREALETALGVMCVSVFGALAVIAAVEGPAVPPALISFGGLRITGEITLGNLGAVLLILWQIGRWGRRMVVRFAHLPEQVDAIEASLRQCQPLCVARRAEWGDDSGATMPTMGPHG